MKSKKIQWLSEFKKNLTNIDNITKDQIVSLEQDMDMLATCDDGYLTHIYNPFKSVTKRSTIDSVLRKNLDQTLVLNNQLLDARNMHYHVVLLDAIDDYVINYYPMINNLDISLNKKRIMAVNPVIKCLAFINDYGKCFLAMPCVVTCMERLFFYKYITSDITLISTTLSKIHKLLELMPLKKSTNDNLSVLPEYGYTVLTAFSGDTHEYDPDFDINAIGTINQYLSNINDIYCKDFRYYLATHIKCHMDRQGNYIFKLDTDSNNKWKNIFANFKQMQLFTLPIYDLSFQCTDAEVAKSYQLDNEYIWIVSLLIVLSETISMTTNIPKGEGTLQTEEIINMKDINKESALAPLVKAKGLNEILLAIQPGHLHKYFIYKKWISSLTLFSSNHKLYYEGANYEQSNEQTN